MNQRKKINSTNFKKTLSKFVTGITIITINSKREFFGKTVNSFASLSLNPPLVLFSLDKKSSSLKKFINSKYIGINILSKKQKKISEFFSHKKNSWGNTDFYLNKDGIPLIKNSLANLSCKNYKTLPNGDHIIFICKIVETKINKSLKPLIYYNNKYF